MGCDIHWCLERKCGDHWVGLIAENGSKAPAADRFYQFFAELAGVRACDNEDYPSPKGLPKDISELTEIDIVFGCWDHSYSYMALDEFVSAYNRAAEKSVGRKTMKAAELFGLNWFPWNEDGEYRVVFAFDS